MKTKKIMATAIALAALSLSAHADLAQVGAVSAVTYGFPAWYQDLGGTTLDLCFPNASDPDGLQKTACLLEVDPPYTFPTAFPDEAFYFRGVSTMDLNADKRAVLVLALEAAFGTGAPVAGQQLVFTRLRVTAGVPVAGDYTVTHPYGVEYFPGIEPSAGSRDIVFSEDVGLTPGSFTDALTSRFGPFLSAALTAPTAAVPAGAPKPPMNINGAQFISDGGTQEFVTGSPFNSNYFMICGVDNAGNPIDLGDAFANGSGYGPTGTCIRTDLFALTGRLHDHTANPIPTPLTFNNVTYSRDNTGTHLDAFVRAGKPLPSLPDPILTIAGLNVPPVKMIGDGNKNYYVQGLTIPTGDLPGNLAVINSADTPPSTAQHKAVDIVHITSAVFNPADNTLTVEANSSDKGFAGATNPNPPELVLLGYPTAIPTPIGGGDPSAVRLTAALPLAALPPDTVTVQSNVGGSETVIVNKVYDTDFGLPAQAGVPYAQDDFATVEAGAGPIVIPVVANDIQNAHSPITSGSLALVGSAIPVAIGEVGVNSAAGTITFTPTNVTGDVVIKYTVSSAAGISNVATATVTVTAPAGGPVPIATADGPATVRTNFATVIDVPANDSGNGGTLNPASVQLSNITGASATIAPSIDAAGKITFTAGNAAGTFGFDYTVANTNGNRSAPAHVTVNVIANETLSVTRARCRTGVWRVTGTTSVPAGNTIALYTTATVPATPTAAQTLASSVTVLADGSWDTGSITKGNTCPTSMSAKSALGTVRNNVAVTR